MNRWLRILTLAGVLISAPAVSVLAQTPGQQATFRILDQDRLLRGSRRGAEILAGIRAAEQALEAENQTIADQLAAEESALTEARATLAPDEFRLRADAFDARVEAIRAERQQRNQELRQQSDQAAQGFFAAALPVLVQMMNDEGILGLLKPDTLILGAEWLDVTDDAIARLDAALSPPAPDPPPPTTQP